MRIQLSLPLHYCLLYSLLFAFALLRCDGNDAKHNAFSSLGGSEKSQFF